MNQALSMLLLNTGMTARPVSGRGAVASSSNKTSKTDGFGSHFARAMKSAKQAAPASPLTPSSRAAPPRAAPPRDEVDRPEERQQAVANRSVSSKSATVVEPDMEAVAAANNDAVVAIDGAVAGASPDVVAEEGDGASNQEFGGTNNATLLATTAVVPPRPNNIMAELMRLARGGAAARELLAASSALTQSDGQASGMMANEVTQETQAAVIKTPWWSLGRDGATFGGVMQENLGAALPLPPTALPVAAIVSGGILEATAMADVMAGKTASGHGHDPNMLLSMDNLDLVEGGDKVGLTDMNLSGRTVKVGNDPNAATRVLSPNAPQFGDELVDQIGRMRLISRPGAPEQVSMTLDPEELGTLHVRVSVDHDRQVQVAIIAESEAVREIINRQIPQLKEALARSDLVFGEVMVQVDSGQTQASDQGGTGQAGDGNSSQFGATLSKWERGEDSTVDLSMIQPTWTGSNDGLSVFA
ncbi:MAG: flagellar hook-length control protein FliK [Magnetococcales bacterium]|nr:flagellar hook-length control protein FliK [Magnetococcales bacterium]